MKPTNFNTPFEATYLPVENINTADARFEKTTKLNNMTPKEKAQELVDKMYEFAIFDEGAKHCALIAVDEIMKEGINSYDKMYWEGVKQEIEKL